MKDDEFAVRRMLVELEWSLRSLDSVDWWSLLASGGLLISAALTVIMAGIILR